MNHHTGPAQLVGTSGPAQGQTFDLSLPLVTLGRAPDNTVAISDQRASGHHARIEQRPDGLWITDLGSTNGTFVNDVRLDQPYHLQSGDQLKIGSSVFSVNLVEAEPPLAPTLAESPLAPTLSEPGFVAPPPQAIPQPVAVEQPPPRSKGCARGVVIGLVAAVCVVAALGVILLLMFGGGSDRATSSTNGDDTPEEPAQPTDRPTSTPVESAGPSEELVPSDDDFTIDPRVFIDPASAPAGSAFTIRLQGFRPEDSVHLSIIYVPSDELAYETSVITDSSGQASIGITTEASTPGGTYSVIAEGSAQARGAGDFFVEESESGDTGPAEPPPATGEAMVQVDPLSGLYGTTHELYLSGFQQNETVDITVYALVNDTITHSFTWTVNRSGSLEGWIKSTPELGPMGPHRLVAEGREGSYAEAEFTVSQYPDQVVEAYENNLQIAQQDIDRFWQEEFPLQWPIMEYSKPALEEYTAPRSLCFDEVSPEYSYANAFYCTNGTIYWERNFLLYLSYEIGHMAIIHIIAHEWGHAIQHQSADSPDGFPWLELQADCYAGVYAGDAQSRGLIGEGDIGDALREARRRLSESNRWYNDPEHGTLDQREAAILDGVGNDVEYCRGFSDY